MEANGGTRRSRDGCWTCRKRRKKCDNTSTICNNCQRMNLKCDRGTRLVWEDDTRRQGMKRRGPTHFKPGSCTAGAVTTEDSLSYHYGQLTTRMASEPSYPLIEYQTAQFHVAEDSRMLLRISNWPFDLDAIDCQLLDRYTKHFSTTYPTCVDATNPFLRVLIPLSMRSRPVLDAMLALCCVQSWDSGHFTMELPMLRYRAKAIRGCQDVVNGILSMLTYKGDSATGCGLDSGRAITMLASGGVDDCITQLLAICVLLVLYEKLSGESSENGTSHLLLFAHLFPQNLFRAIVARITHDPETGYRNDTIFFLSNLFLYNDLVRSTSLRTPTLSSFYADPIEDSTARFYFPNLIARIGAGDQSVTDTEIAAWNGRLDWIPSLALQSDEKISCDRSLTSDPGFIYSQVFEELENFTDPRIWSQDDVMCELYQVAAIVYRRQCHLDEHSVGMGNLPSWAAAMLRLVPQGSQYETALLWPIGIVAQEFTQQSHQKYVLERLTMLEQRFGMKSYFIIRERLLFLWRSRSEGLSIEHTAPFLLG